MSAYLVSNDTLDLLASIPTLEIAANFNVYVKEDTLPPRSDLPYYRRGDQGWVTITRKELSEIKRELSLENLASVNARYPNSRESHVGYEPYRPILLDSLDYPAILGAIACYRYQACESDTWPNSYANLIVNNLEQIVIRKIRGSNWDYTRPANRPERISLMGLISNE